MRLAPSDASLIILKEGEPVHDRHYEKENIK